VVLLSSSLQQVRRSWAPRWPELPRSVRRGLTPRYGTWPRSRWWRGRSLGRYSGAVHASGAPNLASSG